MILLITSYGFSETQAISITILYRIFEFWLPLVAGIGSFLLNRGNILLRILPAMLLALLGIVNIISVLTPPLVERLQLLENFLPVATVHLSNQAVLMAGISMLICAAFLMRGQRNAWLMAVLLSTVSLVGHLTKAIDYEESIFALFTLIILLFTRKQYYVRSDRKLQSFGLRLASLILGMVLVYGVIGFYFLDKKEFGIDFSLSNSIENSIRSFFLSKQRSLLSLVLPKVLFILSIFWEVCPWVCLSMLLSNLIFFTILQMRKNKRKHLIYCQVWSHSRRSFQSRFR
jgi:phosphatidylglycerol lysyltransferase